MIRRLMLLPILALLIASPAAAWHEEGHYYIARAAVESLPGRVPAFFREGGDTIAHCALDPDVVRSRQLPQLRAADSPEHFIDMELLRGRPLPPTRWGYVALCEDFDIDPGKAGTLPYAIAERAQWLAMAFAEHRRWPDNPHIRMKCLVLAGLLAHYTGDLGNPLHTTVHHDGRMERGGDGRYHRAGPDTDLHARVDALPTKLPYAVLFDEPVEVPAPRPDLFAFVVDELTRSHALVDRVYDLAPKIPAAAELSLNDESVRAFTIGRTRAAAAFTAGIFLSAWEKSAAIGLPPWLDRAIFDEHFDPTRVPPQPGK